MIKRETEEAEFKKTLSELREGIISLASMLNKTGHGIVYFGIKRDGSIYGQSAGEYSTSKLANEIKKGVRPSVLPRIFTFEEEGKTILAAEAYGNDRPYSAYGRYYMRCEDQDMEISPDELEHMFINKDISYSEWERTITPYGEESVDEDLLIQYIDNANENSRMNYRYESAEDALTRLGLMEQGRLNNAGMYLFSTLKPVSVKLVRFASETKITLIDNKLFSGNIFECIEEAYRFVLSCINFNARVIGMKRIEKPELPLSALREIIVNSFAHRIYAGNLCNEIEITPEYVRIFNPGTIPLNADPNDFANGDLGSKLHNPLIAISLYRNKTIDAFGTGFRQVFELCRQENVQYSYKSENSGFSFSFKRGNTLLLDDSMDFDTVEYIGRDYSPNFSALPNVMEKNGNGGVFVSEPSATGMSFTGHDMDCPVKEENNEYVVKPAIPTVNAMSGRFVKMSANEAALCEYASKNGGRIDNASRAAAALGKPAISINRALASLVKKHLLRRCGSRKTGWWELVSDN